MSLAARVKHLLDKNGHSFRTAQKRTGVSYETIRRITKGEYGPGVEQHVRRIAQGYNISEKALLEGLDPCGDFEWTIQQAPAVQRLDFLMTSSQERLRLTLDFLRGKYPSVVTIELLAAASGLATADLETILSRWEARQPDLTTTTAICQGIHRLTGISASWFSHGWLKAETPTKAFRDLSSRVIFRATGRSKRHSPERTPKLLKLIADLVG